MWCQGNAWILLVLSLTPVQPIHLSKSCTLYLSIIPASSIYSASQFHNQFRKQPHILQARKLRLCDANAPTDRSKNAWKCFAVHISEKKRTPPPHSFHPGRLKTSTPNIGVSTNLFEGMPSNLRRSKKLWHSPRTTVHSASARPQYRAYARLSPLGSIGSMNLCKSTFCE